MQANNLETQQGAYLDQIVADSPAARAGLQGSSSAESINGVETPVGGDVVVAAEGQPVVDFSDLLATIAEKNPGDELELTVLRDGQPRQVSVELTARPSTG
jgi:S1-C subfamily serine protease